MLQMRMRTLERKKSNASRMTQLTNGHPLPRTQTSGWVYTRAGYEGPLKEKASARAFSLLKAATTAFTFKMLLRH